MTTLRRIGPRQISGFRAQSTLVSDLAPMPAVAKELFLGRIDPRALSYPDVISSNPDRMHDLNVRCRTIRNELYKARDKVDSGVVDKELLDGLRGLGVSGLEGEVAYGGEGLCMTEIMRVLEEFSVNMALSEAVTVANTVAVAPLARFGTSEQKDRYLPKIYSGEWLSAICVTDEFAGVDPVSTIATAVYDAAKDEFVLNGIKTWVTNGSDCTLFTVFANVNTEEHAVNPLTAFLVERNSPGVSVQKGPEKDGMKGLDTATVTFKDVRVPSMNVLGESVGKGSAMLAECSLRGRAFTGARVSAALRELLEFTLKHVMERRTFNDQTLIERDVVRHRLGKMAATLYALESVTYMTGGLADASPTAGPAHIEMEACMTKSFALRAARRIVDGCTKLLGMRAFVEGHPAAVLKRDLEALELWEGTKDINDLTIGLLAMKHVAQNKTDDVVRQRDPYFNVMLFLTKKFFAYKSVRDRKKIKLTMGVKRMVDMRLEDCADYVERSVLQLASATENALVNEGKNAQIRQMDQMRMAEAGTAIFAATSALARANRAMTESAVNHTHEAKLATAFAKEASEYVGDIVCELSPERNSKGDFLSQKLAEYIFGQGRYPFAHPTTKNIF